MTFWSVPSDTSLARSYSLLSPKHRSRNRPDLNFIVHISVTEVAIFYYEFYVD